MLGAWVAAGWAGIAYGVFLTIVALRSPAGIELTGQWGAQPAFKASMALLLALAAAAHPIVRERRWLMLALLFSAVGDVLLAIPWWAASFVLGLGAFLLAHLCFLGALLPLARGSGRSRPRLIAVAGVCAACVALLTWFWPQLGHDGMTIPVTVYMLVLVAMVSAALLARLPTLWTAFGAVQLRLVGRDDRDQPIRTGHRGAGGADLVDVRGGASADHRGLLLRSGVDHLCYTWRVTTRTRQAAAFEPIARVLPMLSVPHLDREFDYLVSEEQSDDAQPGVRVRLRFHGRLVDGFILERRTDTDHVGKLAWLDRVVSAEAVLTPEIRRLVDAVAARYAGTRADVLRLGSAAAARQSRARKPNSACAFRSG